MALTHAWHDMVHDMRDEVRDITTITRVDAARQAYLAMWATFVALPLVFGLDKFAEVMTSNWAGYLATWANDALPGSAADAMLWIGAVEIIVAILVFAMPRVGGDVFALWMGVVAINLFSTGDHHELAIGALALAVCSLAMARLSTGFHNREAAD